MTIRTPDETPAPILVTGGAGYIGQVLTAAITALGYPIRHLDALWFTGSLLPNASDAQNPMDVRDVLAAQIVGCRQVFHLAALSNDALGALNEKLTWDINFSATVRLAEAAKAAGVRRFIYFSTCSVYGSCSGDRPLEESHEAAPLTAYAASKLASERHLQTLSEPTFEVVVLRNATAFGPSSCPRLDLVFNDFVDNALRQKCITMLSDGNAIRPFVHVRDIVNVALFFITHDLECTYSVINVGSDDANLQISQLADIVARIARVPLRKVEGAQRDARSYRVSFAKLGRLLPHYRFVSPEQGVYEWLDFSLRTGLHTLERTAFVRIATLQRLLAEGQLDERLQWRSCGSDMHGD